MGQELYSCDTTQIDVFTSARFTRHHACPMDNGWVPVGIYLVARSSRPRKSIHSAAPRPDPTTQGSLQVCRTGYSSFSQVSCCLVVGVIIAAPPPLVKEKFFRGDCSQGRHRGRPLQSLPLRGRGTAEGGGGRTPKHSLPAKRPRPHVSKHPSPYSFVTEAMVFKSKFRV